MLTSNNSDWATPKTLFDSLDKEFHFTLDFCATEKSKKCQRFYSKEQDALKQNPKGEVIFCNPPYGREIGKFVKKCFELSKTNIIVMLIPARTNTNYWHTYIYDSTKHVFRVPVRFLKGRVKFCGLNTRGEWIENQPCTFPSCIVIFGR
jgi:site-specific DNA-methyltransferase (adenine-specific)